MYNLSPQDGGGAIRFLIIAHGRHFLNHGMLALNKDGEKDGEKP